MSEVIIPFNYWSMIRLSNNTKVATSRYKQYGKKGDMFSVNGESFIILLSVKLPLWMIRDYLYKLEGCVSPTEFVELWTNIHPSGFKANDEVWFHLFDKISFDNNQKKLEL